MPNRVGWLILKRQTRNTADGAAAPKVRSQSYESADPKAPEFIISIDEKEEPRHQECWEKLNQIVKDYQKQGKSVYTETFIEDNEEKVKELQKEYKFSYTIEER